MKNFFKKWDSYAILICVTTLYVLATSITDNLNKNRITELEKQVSYFEGKCGESK